jgi:predicted nucleotidyltransferase component of viral defense system
MNNLIFEMKKIVNDARENNFPNALIRNQLKEFLHYFVLDFIYNSKFKDLIFYGGSCLRVLYDLPRMSEDLDFEADENMDFNKLANSLEDHFRKNLNLKEKFSINRKKSINRIFLVFPIMYKLGLSAHQKETLRIKVEIRSVAKNNLNKLKPIVTPKSKYSTSFIVKHYDLPTLFASKLGAILDRSQKGFTVGKLKEGINFKGRDFYDLIWYMEKGVSPNKEMLKLNGINESSEEVFNKIEIFITKTNIKAGLKRDLEPLFGSADFVENFANNFIQVFQNLRLLPRPYRRFG